jgi:hypothetical protein
MISSFTRLNVSKHQFRGAVNDMTTSLNFHLVLFFPALAKNRKMRLVFSNRSFKDVFDNNRS